MSSSIDQSTTNNLKYRLRPELREKIISNLFRINGSLVDKTKIVNNEKEYLIDKNNYLLIKLSELKVKFFLNDDKKMNKITNYFEVDEQLTGIEYEIDELLKTELLDNLIRNKNLIINNHIKSDQIRTNLIEDNKKLINKLFKLVKLPISKDNSNDDDSNDDLNDNETLENREIIKLKKEIYLLNNKFNDLKKEVFDINETVNYLETNNGDWVCYEDIEELNDNLDNLDNKVENIENKIDYLNIFKKKINLKFEFKLSNLQLDKQRFISDYFYLNGLQFCFICELFTGNNNKIYLQYYLNCLTIDYKEWRMNTLCIFNIINHSTERNNIQNSTTHQFDRNNLNTVFNYVSIDLLKSKDFLFPDDKLKFKLDLVANNIVRN